MDNDIFWENKLKRDTETNLSSYFMLDLIDRLYTECSKIIKYHIK